MALIEENRSICIKCEGVVRFCTSNENEKRRHIAIVHGKETFSSLRCGKCQRKYFDFDHFAEHLQASPECRKDSWMIKPEPLSAHLEMAFAALVEQVMRPVETDQMEKAPISGGNGEGKMDRTSGETSKRSMDGTKRKVKDTSASDGTSSTKRQRNVKKIRTGKRMRNKKASRIIRRVGKARNRKGQQRLNGGSGTRTGKARAVIFGDPNSVTDQFKLRPAIVRREYCLDLIGKFATAGKLRCQLCATECTVIQDRSTWRTRCTTTLIQHALRHLKKPIYHCPICNITKFTTEAIWRHMRECHWRSEGYNDCADQYHLEIMDMLGQCFEQGEHVSVTPGDNTKDKCVRSSIMRRQYCLDLIDKFSTAGKLQCQLCSMTCGVFHTTNSIRRIFTHNVIQHALGHLKKPVYHCRICNVTNFTYLGIKYHIRGSHPNSEDGYEDCANQYHQEIMDTLRLCYHVDNKKRPVEQVETRLAIPARCYDNTRSPLYNERMHHVRSLAARYSDQTEIACQLCSMICPLHTEKSTGSIRNHIMFHLNKDIYQCILCGTGIKSYNSLRTHILYYHQMKSMQGAYMDYSDKYHQDFLDMIGKCFDPDNGNGVVKSKKKVRSGISGGTSRKATPEQGKATGTVPADVKCFQCRRCQFRTKYEILMKKHSKVFHGH